MADASGVIDHLLSVLFRWKASYHIDGMCEQVLLHRLLLLSLLQSDQDRRTVRYTLRRSGMLPHWNE